ncbi:hypothetical protein Q6247_25755, partial [Klebsiella pneumoniae]
DMETKLTDCLQAVAAPAAVAVDYDASPCEHIISLKLRLLDAIHGFYIKALHSLPPSVRFEFCFCSLLLQNIICGCALAFMLDN